MQTIHKLELEVFQSLHWKVQIKLKPGGPVSRLRAMSVLGSIANLQSAGFPLRAIGWRIPGSRRQFRFARFLVNPAHELTKGAQL
jgi:hypothetical protein